MPMRSSATDHRATGPLRVLVTGGCGFIGSAVVRLLVRERGASVLNVDALTYAGDRSTVAAVAGDPAYAFSQLDIRESEAFAQALAGFRPDAVLHLAAESHVDRSIDRPDAFVSTNVMGTCSVLEAATRYWRTVDGAARDGFRFLHVSTDEVYGSLPIDSDARFTEESPYAPNSPYAASKAGSDHLARAWYRTYGLPVIVSNCSNNYGPYQFPEKLIPTMVLAALEGRPLPVYGDGLNVRDWLHVDDHARALLALVEHGEPGETYLVGGNRQSRNIDLVKLLCAILDERLPNAPSRPHASLIRMVTDRPGHDRRYAVEDAKLRKRTGWAPLRSFEDGLRETVDWYLANQDWWASMLDADERARRRGLSADGRAS